MSINFVNELETGVKKLTGHSWRILAVMLVALALWLFVRTPVLSDLGDRRMQVLIHSSEILYEVKVDVDSEQDVCVVDISNIRSKDWGGDIRLIMRAVYPESKEIDYVADITLSPTAPRKWGNPRVEFKPGGRRLELQVCATPKEDDK